MTAFMRLEVWSDIQAAGGTRLAFVRDPFELKEQRSLFGDELLTTTISIYEAASGQLVNRRVLRVVYVDETFDEWRINTVVHSWSQEDEAPVATVSCIPILADLANVLARRVDTTGLVLMDFEGVSLTPTEHINNYILPALSDEGMTWLALGTIDPSLPIDIVYEWDTALAALFRVAEASTCEFQLRRNGTTQYLIDIVTAVNASVVSDFVARFGKNMVGVKRTTDSSEQGTRVYPRGAQEENERASIGDNLWKITAGGGTTTITIADPAGGDGPIGADDEFNTMVVRTPSGTDIVINDTVLSTQQLVIASAGSLVNGNLISIRRSAAQKLTFLEFPADKTTYKLKSLILDRPDIPSVRNYFAAINPVFRTYTTSPGVPDQWAMVGTGVTFTRETNTARWKSGGKSVRIQGNGDGTGIESAYDSIDPSAASPHFSFFANAYVAAGAYRAEIIAGKALLTISSITYNHLTGLASCVTSTAHGFVNDDLVEITGVSPTGYNGIFKTIVLSTTNFQFQPLANPHGSGSGSGSGGTMRARPVWKFPTNQDGIAQSSVVNDWDSVGQEAINLFAIGATVAKVRVLQAGTTALDAYLDAVQLARAAIQQALVESCGANQLWQYGHDLLRYRSVPLISYEIDVIHLNDLDSVTFAGETVVIGQTIPVVDTLLNFSGSTRVIEYIRDLLENADLGITLSNRLTDLIDSLIRPRLPAAKPNPATAGTELAVQMYPSVVTSAPTTVRIQLSPRPSNAKVYYVVQEKSALPPPIGDVLWLPYTSSFTIPQVQTEDVLLSAYAAIDGRVSKVFSWFIDKKETPAVNLSSSESPVQQVLYNWTPNDDVRRVRLYERATATAAAHHWPVNNMSVTISRSGTVATVVCASAHRLIAGDSVTISGAVQTQYNGEFVTTPDATDPLKFTYTVAGSPATPATGTIIMTSARGVPSETYFLREMDVNADGAGYDVNGASVPGGTSWQSPTVRTSNDVIKTIAIPFNSNGVTDTTYRGYISRVINATISAAILSCVGVVTSYGSACSFAAGVMVQITWNPSAAVTDASHDLEIHMTVNGVDNGILTTITDPDTHAGRTATIQLGFKKTAGKFDTPYAITLTYKLISGGVTVDQGNAWIGETITTTCGVV